MAKKLDTSFQDSSLTRKATKMLKLRLIIYLLSLLAVSPTTALRAQGPLPMWFHLLDKEAGLSSNVSITGVMQDSEGYIWISTYGGGLNRFDGASTKVFRSNHYSSQSLSSDQVYGNLFEDSKKNIWFSTTKSIDCYLRKHNRFQHYSLIREDSTKVEKYLGAFHLERDSFLWIRAGMNNEIYRFNIHDPADQKLVGATRYDVTLIAGTNSAGEVRYLFSLDGTKQAGLEVLEIDPDGKLIKTSNHFYDQINRPILHLYSVIYESPEAVWLSTDQGLFLWNMKQEQAPVIRYSSEKQCYQSLKIDESKFLIREKQTGLLQYDQHNNGHFQIKAYLTSQPGLDVGLSLGRPLLYQDQTLWIEYQKSGLLFGIPQKVKFHHLSKPTLLDNNTNYTFRTILQAQDQSIWCTAYPFGLFHLNKHGGKMQFFSTDENVAKSALPSNQIFDIHQDTSGNIWVGTEDCAALFQKQTNQFIPINDDQGNPVTYVEQFLTLTDGRLLAVSYTQGLYQIVSQDGIYQMTPLSGFHKIRGYSNLYEDSQRLVYIGYDNRKVEVRSWKQNQLTLLSTFDLAGTINGFYEDSDEHTLWIATSEGLIALDKRQFGGDTIHYNVFNQQYGLVDNAIQSIAPDNKGRLWLGTKSGISLFNPKDTSFHPFSKSDGAASIEMNEKSVMSDRNGNLWFGGNKGITIIQRPSQLSYLQQPLNVQITGFKINDEDPDPLKDTCSITGATNIGAIKQLRLPHRKNTLSFDFVAIDYSGPESTQLRYILEPHDRNWVTLEKGERGFTRYSNLSSGTYELKITGANSDGHWHKNSITSLEIIILPRLIERRWFQTLLILVLLGTGLAIYRYQIREVREKADLRTRVVENKMAALRAQMNPHFAFNGLQTLNSFITSKDMNGALVYVSQFAKLMRKILENSRKQRISLQNEIELLNIYMGIEALRFSQAFQHEVRIDEQIDTYDVKIPAMLLQPFVENAIKHGLSHKGEGGKITITFSKEGNHIKCIIEDNGVGRAKAREFQGQQGRRHDSKGLLIIEEQLEILKQARSGNYEYRIIDLFDEHEDPAGTRVEVTLSLQ